MILLAVVPRTALYAKKETHSWQWPDACEVVQGELTGVHIACLRDSLLSRVNIEFHIEYFYKDDNKHFSLKDVTAYSDIFSSQ